jgi:hypothetical protein
MAGRKIRDRSYKDGGREGREEPYLIIRTQLDDLGGRRWSRSRGTSDGVERLLQNG